MIIRVDVDGTLCYGSEGGNYAAAAPRRKMIRRVNDYHAQGHRIIVQTYRGDTTGKDWGALTMKQLRDWGVKYHSLAFETEHYDVAVDDKAAPPWEDDAPPKRSYMVGYGVWNKQDMVGWMLDGVAEHFPGAAHLAVVFDACEDESERVYDALSGQAILKAIPHEKIVCAEPVGEVGAHNLLLKYFLEQTGCDALVVLQDDQRFAGPPLPTLDRLLDAYDDWLGLVGLRAGYEVGVSRVVGSRWGVGENRQKLPPGAWAERTYVNTGPMMYNRRAVERVGLLDDEFKVWFAWEDYAHRCVLKGLKNVVVDVPVRHVKFGRCKPSGAYAGGSHKQDHERMRRKWPDLGW